MSIFNISISLVLVVVSFSYLQFFSALVPAKYALLINVLFVPFLLGFIGGWVIKSPYYWKIILLTMIPIFHFFFYGEDPAKKEIGNIVILTECLFIWLGIGFYYLETSA